LGYTGEDRERYAYLDLLATALTDHEKNLDKLIKRLDKVCLELSSIVELESKEQYAAEESPYRGRETIETLLKDARDILLE
jgi:hypothetical protein